MLDFLANWGTEIFVALGSIITTSIGYLVARDKDRNQFILAAIKEINDENKGDKEYLSNRVDSLQNEIDTLKASQFDCEKSKSLLEVKYEGLKKEIDFVIASYGNPEAIKVFYNLQKKSKGKYFQHANIDEIYAKLVNEPNAT